MFKKKDQEIKNNTMRIAKGTFMLSQMPDSLFTSTYKKMEKQNKKSPCKYELPNWFNIKFIKKENEIYEFQGSFTDGNGYPLVYKKDFLRLLKKNKVNIEQLDENTYKIIRKSHE